jgi:hypothetical protein
MNNKTLVWILILVVLGGLAYWYFSGSQANMAPSSQTTDTATSNTSGNTTGQNLATTNTFHSIFTQQGNYSCSYEQVATSSQSSSIIYIADGKMRGEFRTTTSTGTKADLMIYSGGLLYSWKEGAVVGTKTSIKTLADLPSVIPADLTSGAILGASNNNVSWDCHDWIKDTTQFTIPTYVKFN